MKKKEKRNCVSGKNISIIKKKKSCDVEFRAVAQAMISGDDLGLLKSENRKS